MSVFNWIGCFVAGRHDYDVRCEPGTVFLKCIHCGRRSPGWVLDDRLEASRGPNRSPSSIEIDAQTPANEHAR